LTKRAHCKPDYQRAAVANEAARIIQEEGLPDFRSAKEKAVERLGLSNGDTRLPSNEEVAQALTERNRIFRGADHPELLNELRRAALLILHTLDIYHARLVGPVLSGTATDFSAIDLHLFSDSPETVGVTLDVLDLSQRATQIRHQFRRGESEYFPGYRFRALDFEYAATVFSINHRRRSPLSPIDGKPMSRASIQEIEALLS
jgi:hypothetical protein